jgi:hypothetical protein
MDEENVVESDRWLVFSFFQILRAKQVWHCFRPYLQTQPFAGRPSGRQENKKDRTTHSQVLKQPGSHNVRSHFGKVSSFLAAFLVGRHHVVVVVVTTLVDTAQAIVQ